jgi:hypothetical protein
MRGKVALVTGQFVLAAMLAERTLVLEFGAQSLMAIAHVLDTFARMNVAIAPGYVQIAKKNCTNAMHIGAVPRYASNVSAHLKRLRQDSVRKQCSRKKRGMVCTNYG